MIDIDFTKEGPGVRAQHIVDLGSPTAALMINESRRGEIPNPTIPLLINGIALYGFKNALAATPSQHGHQ
jgi:hypothetical protein